MPNLRIATFDFRTATQTAGNGTEARVAGPLEFSPPSDHTFTLVLGWMQVTYNAGATTVTPRVRGQAAAPISNAPLVGEANAEALPVAAGQNSHDFIMAGEVGLGLGATNYNVTLDTAGGTFDTLQLCGLALSFE